MESVLKKTIKSICCSHGWSYGAFWGYNHQNPMLLTLEDAYYEDQMTSLVDNLLLQFHILGQGIIGQAASTRKHCWILSDSCFAGVQNISQEYSELRCQFSSGIKTIAVVPIQTKGVLQFGSTRKISESTEFLNRTKRLFQEMRNVHGSEYTHSSLTNGVDDLNELFSSLVSSGSFCNENNQEMQMHDYPYLYNIETHGTLFNDLNEAILQPVVSVNKWSNEDSILTYFDNSAPFKKEIQGEPSTILPSLPEEYTPADFSTNNLCQPMAVSSDLGWGDILTDFPIEQSHSDGQKDIFEVLEQDFRFEKDLDTQKDFLMPFACTNQSEIHTNMSKCVSELDVSSIGPRKGLFSELGLENFLQGGSSSSCVTNSSFEDQPPFTKRRKIENLSSNASQAQGGLWIDDSYSINAGNNITEKPKKPEESIKVRKRAKPGQSTRPRPKDRQMIQDRLKELKGIIPNGAKMSIDSLLDQTVKYMLFLQSVTKYAEKLKEVDQTQGNGLALKDNSDVCHAIGSGGATWAFEVGGQMGCPILIKDLSQPGQKLIEMICEDRGFFLEIADVIRGFGFNILKGEMEVQGDKLWAHFIVEENNKENKHITRPTRVEILESILKHTQSMGTRGIEYKPSNQLLRNDGIPQLNYHQQQPRLAFPITNQ
ncbi:hypothetical protein ACFE04_007568 [Oxalis oulophora]